MKFQCFVCNKILSISYDVDPVHGDIMMRPWYVETGTGLNHHAVFCLKCFTIHDTSGSSLRFIFQTFLPRPLKIHCAIRLIKPGNSIEFKYANGHTQIMKDVERIDNVLHSFPEDIRELLIIKKQLHNIDQFYLNQ